MLAVLVFITLVLILGAGILTLTDATVKQSRTLSLSDNVFYSAESALQVYAQIVEERVRTVNPYSAPSDITYSELKSSSSDIETWRSAYLTDIKIELKAIYDDVIPSEDGSLGIDIDFYLGNVRLDLDDPYINFPDELALIIDTREQIISEFEKTVEKDSEFDDSYMEILTPLTFYPTKAISYSVTATMGGRTLVAYVVGVDLEGREVSSSGTGDAIPTFNEPEFNRPVAGSVGRDEVLGFGSYDGGAYYKSNNTDVYKALEKNADGSYVKSGTDYKWETIDADKKLESYNGLITQLKYVISETDALTRNSVLGNIPATDTRWVAGTNKNATHIRVTGNYTLTGDYPNLEYLEVVNGNLTISGTVNCPKLRGVYVGGGSGTDAISISVGAKFNGNSDIGGTIFLTKGRDIKLSTDNSKTLILFGKFLASGGNITIKISGGGNADSSSNSMFVATKNGVSDKGKLETTGQNFRMAAYSAGQVPQYYAENYLKLYVQNKQASFEGIFATLSDEPIFDGSVDDRNLRGIFVGNCGKLNGTVRVLPFNPDQEDKMLPGGLFDAEGEGFITIPVKDESTPDGGSLKIVIDDVSFGEKAKLVIRETTGDGDL